MKSVLPLMNGEKGHFKFESGYHGELWLDMFSIFLKPKELTPYVQQLSKQLSTHQLDAVCGAFAGGAFLAELIAKELGIEFFYAERITHPENKELFSVEYVLPEKHKEKIEGKRVGIVDDVISTGSAIKGTFSSVKQSGANVITVSSLLVLGNTIDLFLHENNLTLETLERMDSNMWKPDNCPLCKEGIPLTDLIS